MTQGRGHSQALYTTIWRWHFYAGLFVIPFILILAVTGAAYLFKPQVERWEERAFQNLSNAGAVAPQRQVDMALAAHPGAELAYYRLPEKPGDAAMIRLTAENKPLDVFVSPQGEVLGSIDPDSRLIAWARAIHGQLLLGKWGSGLVELVASWAMVLVLSGLYLWWPRGQRVAGVIWPRINGGRRIFWRDLHAVTAFWISGSVLVLLATGLPWAGVWGSGFQAVRMEMGWVKGPQDWTIGGEEQLEVLECHDHAAMGTGGSGVAQLGVSLDEIARKADEEGLAFPVLITPPGASGAMEWTVRSDAQNRPLRITITYDAMTGQELSRRGFSDGHAIDQVIGYGIAWHEGQLFGWVNQLIGLLTAVGLVAVAASGFILWRRRKPENMIGAPPQPKVPARMGGVALVLLVLALLLPLLAASLVLLWLFERLALPHLPRLSRWLGVSARPAVNMG